MDYDEFNCPICHLKYNEEMNLPRLLLSCGHTICTQCIKISLANENKTLTCPEDQIVYSNIDNVESMPKNMTLIKLINKANESIGTPKRTNANANGNGNNAILSLSSHNRLLESIKTKNKSAIRKNAPLYCTRHQNRTLEIVCLDDNCKICTNCALFGEHRNHNIMNIDDFQNDIEIKAELLIDLFELIDQLTTIDNPSNNDIFDHPSNNKDNKNKLDVAIELNTLAQCIKQKSTELNSVIREYTNELISKVKEEESLILNDLNAKMNFLLNKVDFIKHFPEELSNTANQWKNQAQLKLNIINDITDFEEECLKLIDDNKPNSLLYNDLIEKGETILSEYDKMNTFPIRDLITEISNISLEVDRGILLKPILSLKNEINVIELEKRFSFEAERDLTWIEKDKENNINDFSRTNPNNIDDNNTTMGTSLINIPLMTNIGYCGNVSQNVSFMNLSDDSIIHNLNPNHKLKTKVKTKLNKKQAPQQQQQKRKASFDLIDFNNLSMLNPNKPKSNQRNPLRENHSNPKLLSRSTSRNSFNRKQQKPLQKSKTPSKDKICQYKTHFKNEVVNLSRTVIGNEGAKEIALLLNHKHSVKELKLTRCKIGDEGAIAIFKALELSSSTHSSRIVNVNIANNSLTDKSSDAIIAFLLKSNSIKTIYLTNNTFSSKAKERIKLVSNSNGKKGLKIFI